MSVILQGQGLKKRFGGVHALRGVDLEIDDREVLGVIGPNGSGKSTLFNVLAGEFRPDDGSVVWCGTDITRVPAHRRARMGLVRTFQERMVFGRMPVRENIEFALLQRGGGFDESDIQRALEFVGLPQRVLTQSGDQLSWGQSRLVGLVLGVVLRPQVLMLDEPFAGLNRLAAQEVNDALLKLRDEGVGLVIVEHEMSLLLPLCDRVVVLAEGRKVAEDTPNAILANTEVQRAYFGTARGNREAAS